MRYISSLCLRKGLVLSKSLYGSHGELWLSKGTVLTEFQVKRIAELFSGVYVSDIDAGSGEAKALGEGLLLQILRNVQKFFAFDDKTELSTIKLQVANIVNSIIKNKSLLEGLLDLKCYDEYTYHHSVNVCTLSVVMGISMGLQDKELCSLGMAALLHDIGKTFIKPGVLNKTSALTKEEWVLLKKHSKAGMMFLRQHYSTIPASALVAIEDHHERFDGCGYPNKKKGDEISPLGRIITIADVYDAMTSTRSYHKAELPSNVIEYIMGNSGTMFDPRLVKLFISKVAPFPVGTTVELSDGRSGVVEKVFSDCCSRPSVRMRNGEILNLRTGNYNVTIVGIAEAKQIEKAS